MQYIELMLCVNILCKKNNTRKIRVLFSFNNIILNFSYDKLFSDISSDYQPLDLRSTFTNGAKF